MADHKREQIIDALETILNTLVPGTVDAVNRTPDAPFALTTNKIISLQAGSDTTQDDSGWDTVFSILPVQIGIHAREVSTTQIETTLNEIRKQITVAVFTDATLGLSFVNDTTEESASEPEIDGEGENVTATINMIINILYNRNRNDPSI